MIHHKSVHHSYESKTMITYNSQAKKESTKIQNSQNEEGHQLDSKLISLQNNTGEMRSHANDNVITDDVSSNDMYSCEFGSNCYNLQKLFKYHWPKNKPKAAFYFLVRPKKYDNLAITFDLLHKHFNRQFDYPIIIFHEQDFTDYIPDTHKLISNQLYFHQVKFMIDMYLVNILICSQITVLYTKITLTTRLSNNHATLKDNFY